MTFDCPKCGAPVNYESANDPLGSATTVRCSYCSASLMVPDELRGRPARVLSHVQINLGPLPSAARGLKSIWLLLLIPFFGVVLGVLALVGVLAPAVRMVSPAKRSPVAVPGGTRATTLGGKTGDGFATEVLKFGSEGIGPGMFKDARSLAVDGNGHIYVGEYSGGRVQVFDASGQFLTQWTVDPKMPLRALAADRKGIVYVVQSGIVSRFDGQTGKSLGAIPYSAGWGFDDVVTTADGGLVTAWYKNRDDIVRFSSEGQVTRSMRAVISSVSGDSELNTRVATDGLGNIYALGTFNNAVFKFSSEGKFVNRFGSAGDQPGQFRAPQAIAVDGKGRVFVSDIKGIQVFDADGRYLRIFKADGIASGMVCNDKNELFVAARNHVVKFALN
ncbi:MAG: 6-bladed beta-propeller [Acidobacteriota bacterium]|nr:6-bladed beta-propeller [Acidobacteriota bacterium]